MTKKYDLIIGSHVSLSAPNFFLGSVQEALSYEANALMVYTGAPQNTIRKPMDDKNIALAHELLKQNDISQDNIIVHAPYIINLCSENPSTRVLAVDFLKQEIKRCEQIGAKILVLHPGSRLNQPLETGLKQVVDGINFVLDSMTTNVIICLETMAGKGSEVGRSLAELKWMITNINKQDNIGVCIDTCHLNDAGYKMAEFDKFLEAFDAEIGLHKVKVVHLNDSKNPLNARKDRHENIGYGYIGFEPLCYVAWHEKLDGIPKILETPYVTYEDNNNKKKSCPPYKYEIDIIRQKKWFDFRQTIFKDK